jgi:hypothetical protein
MAESPHAGGANQSEADDEDGWAKSSTDETDSYVDHAATLAFPTLAKRRSSHSGSGKVVPLAEMNVANLCWMAGSEHISEHDRTRKHSAYVI